MLNHSRSYPRLAAVLAACLSLSTLHAQAPALALPERRAIKQYQETKFPDLQMNIKAGAGFDVPLEVNWDAIAKAGEGDRYMEDDYWTNVFFVPLASALKGIATDEMGAKALKDKLKKIVITFDEKTAPASAYENGVNFEGGTLTINFMPFTNAGDTEARTKAIRAGLEAKL